MRCCQPARALEGHQPHRSHSRFSSPRIGSRFSEAFGQGGTARRALDRARRRGSARSSRYSAAATCTARGMPSSSRPIGTLIAGWRVRLKAKVQGAQSRHSASRGRTRRLVGGEGGGRRRRGQHQVVALVEAGHRRAPPRSAAPRRRGSRPRSCRPRARATSSMPGIEQRALLRRDSGDQPRQRRRPRRGRRWRACRAGPGRPPRRSRPRSSSSLRRGLQRRLALRVERRVEAEAADQRRRAARRRRPRCRRRQSRGSSGRQNGSRRSCCAMAESISAASRTRARHRPGAGHAGEGAMRPLRHAARRSASRPTSPQ